MSELHICLSPDCNCNKPGKIFTDDKIQYKRPYTQLHLHSTASLLDGAGGIDEYIKIAKENNMPGFALTDHGNPVMLFDFYKKMKANGLKPILGLEFYLAQDLELKKPSRERENLFKDCHQSVMIKNEQGYKNFCKLTYLSFTQGYYYKPRLNFEMLFENKQGLIVTSSCMAGYINQCTKIGNYKEAENMFKRFVIEFGEDFYGEIQFNEINDKEKFNISQYESNENIIKLCKKYDIKVIIGGDTHYAKKEDSELQDILISSITGKGEKKESFIHARHLYFHVSEDYYDFNKKFNYNYDENFITECLDNSLEFLNKINFDFVTNKLNFPEYKTNNPVNVDKTNKEILLEMAYDGLAAKITKRKSLGEKFSKTLIQKYIDRIEYEIKIFEQKGIIDYFLIFQDWINWTRNEGYSIGIARGSVGGSIVAYCVGIINLDAIKHNLLFERFINPERTAMPDIDVDVPQGVRKKVLEYLKQKYGKESVLGVVTFTNFGAKSAIQDISRGLGKDTSRESILFNYISKLPGLESTNNVIEFFNDIEKNSSTIKEIKEWIADNQDVIKWSQKIIGQMKGLGTHAGGILITPGPVYDYIPVVKGKEQKEEVELIEEDQEENENKEVETIEKEKNIVVTAFKEADGSSKDLSELGLLKLDVLGLKTLNIISNSIKDIKKNLGIDITDQIEYPDLTDGKVIQTARNLDLLGVFQFDQSAQPMVKDIQPDCFEDLNAINALNRPGPKETFSHLYSKWKKLYLSGKKKECEKDEMYPKLDFMLEFTDSTYGCMIFQEQFMLMVAKAADFNLGEADNFRRAIAWTKDHPKYHTVSKYFEQLEKKMLEKGYSKEDVDYFVDYCRKFMGYSFNASHSFAYSYIAFQCLYLKTYYPLFFYCAYINCEHRDDYQTVINELTAKDIEILPPHIIKSSYHFTVEDGKIRVGLKAIKGLGISAYNSLQETKISECKNLSSFFSKKFGKFNIGALTKTIDCGCFDEFNNNREKVKILATLYKDPKIEKWFTRKKGKLQSDTIPESLKPYESYVYQALDTINKSSDPWAQFGDDNESLFEDDNDIELIDSTPWFTLIDNIEPYIEVKKTTPSQRKANSEEILGFDLEFSNQLKEIDNIIHKMRKQNVDLVTLSERQNDKSLCVFYVLERNTKKTKTDKSYWQLKIADKTKNGLAKCWQYNIEFEKDKIYMCNIKEDEYGYSIIVNNNLAILN